MKKRIVFYHVICVIPALVCALAGILSVTVFSSTPARMIKSATTVLDEPILLPENEGKVVIVRGTVTVKTPIVEPIFGFSFDSPVVEVVTETYTYSKNTNRYTPGVGNWQWTRTSTQTLRTTAFIGELALDEALAARIPTDGYATAEDVWGQIPPACHVLPGEEIAYFSTEDLSDISQANGSLYGGTVRHIYALPRANETYTVIGVQQGGQLTYLEDIAGFSLRLGTLSAEEMADSLRSSQWTVFWLTIPAACIFLLMAFLACALTARENPRKPNPTVTPTRLVTAESKNQPQKGYLSKKKRATPEKGSPSNSD